MSINSFFYPAPDKWDDLMLSTELEMVAGPSANQKFDRTTTERTLRTVSELSEDEFHDYLQHAVRRGAHATLGVLFNQHLNSVSPAVQSLRDELTRRKLDFETLFIKNRTPAQEATLRSAGAWAWQAYARQAYDTLPPAEHLLAASLFCINFARRHPEVMALENADNWPYFVTYATSHKNAPGTIGASLAGSSLGVLRNLVQITNLPPIADIPADPLQLARAATQPIAYESPPETDPQYIVHDMFKTYLSLTGKEIGPAYIYGALQTAWRASTPEQ